jgi:luciferase family oxidoreductase group 1
MIGQIAAITQHMHIGSGGVMLPNWAPLAVAERFKVLEALYPGRIDLGLGRAPGTDPATSYMLRRRQGMSEEDDFLERFQELMLLETRGFPAGHPFHNVRAMPAEAPLPPIFLLGSSDYSAQLAGQIGAAFSFAHHFATFDAVEAMRLYRDSFRPPMSCAPTPMKKLRGWRARWSSISFAAPRANTCRCRRLRKHWPTLIPTRTRRASHRTVRGSRSVRPRP